MSGRVLCFWFVAVILTGCLPSLHPWATDRTVHGSYDQVFQATLETLEAREFPIERADRDAGRIETGARPDGIEPNQPVKTVDARIDENNGDISVRLFMTFLRPKPEMSRGSQGTGSHSSRVAEQALDKSEIYDEYLDAIEDRVEAVRVGSGS